MFYITTDTEIFKKFWENDSTAMPRWFQDGVKTWDTSLEDFLGFCDDCERVYVMDDVALLYVQKIGDSANIHFSLLRGEMPSQETQIAVRDDIYKSYDRIFGWCGSRNRGLKKILEFVGLTFNGFKMWHGTSHDQVLEWHCYAK